MRGSHNALAFEPITFGLANPRVGALMTGFCPKFPCSPGDLFHFSGLILTGGQLD